MAKVNFTAVVSDIRNKLAGSVFSRNRGGAYMRTKSTPVNAQTTYQTAVRNRLAGNSQAWRGLTAAQRQGWADAAPNFPRTDQFGNQIILSGAQLYTGLNNNLINAGEAAIADAPTPQAVEAVTSASLAIANGAQSASLTFAPTPVPADTVFRIEATPAVSPGRNFVKNRFRQISILAAAATSPANIAAAYIAKFGAIGAAGQKVFIRITPISTISGQQGGSLTISATIAA